MCEYFYLFIELISYCTRTRCKAIQQCYIMVPAHRTSQRLRDKM